MHTYSSLIVHIVYGTYEHYPFLGPDIRPKVHAYTGGIIRTLGGVPIIVGGWEDHLHNLVVLPPAITPSDFVGRMKSGSSTWIKEALEIPKFGWQRGFGIFSVGRRDVPQVVRYIENQEEHHRTRTFAEEVREFLRVFNLEILDDERGLRR